MEPVFATAEKFQVELNSASLASMHNGIVELYSKTAPALELSLAVLAESVDLKASLTDIEKASA